MQQFLNSFHQFFFSSLFLNCFLVEHVFTIYGLELALGLGLWSFYTIRERSEYQNLIQQMAQIIQKHLFLRPLPTQRIEKRPIRKE